MARAAKSSLERLQERIRTADRGWFFAAIADNVAHRRQAKGMREEWTFEGDHPNEEGYRLLAGVVLAELRRDMP